MEFRNGDDAAMGLGESNGNGHAGNGRPGPDGQGDDDGAEGFRQRGAGRRGGRPGPLRRDGRGGQDLGRVRQGRESRFEVGQSASLQGGHRFGARRAADRFRQGHADRPLPAPGRNRTRTSSPASPTATPTTRSTRSGSTTTSPGCGSCRRPRCCRTAAPTAGCRSRATSTSVDDSLEGIVGTWNENVWLASRGGGIGTYWGNVRGIGEPVGLNGKTSGIIPFVRVMD